MYQGEGEPVWSDCESTDQPDTDGLLDVSIIALVSHSVM